MIRVVLDTNIIVSALLQPLGPPAQVFVLTLGGLIRLCVSGSVYAEYEEVISRPRFARSPDIIAATLQSIREKGTWVRPIDRVTACADPDDDIFLECAQAASADYLVTGNLKHFPLSWAGCRIVTPRWLLDNLPGEKPAAPRRRDHKKLLAEKGRVKLLCPNCARAVPFCRFLPIYHNAESVTCAASVRTQRPSPPLRTR